MAIDFRCEVPDLSGWVKDVRRIGQKAVRVAVDAAGIGMKTELRQQIDAAGYKAKLGNMFTNKTHPAAGVGSFRAAASIFPRGEAAEKYLLAFAEGVTITAHGGRWLCIPTDHNPRRSMKEGPVVKAADLMRVTATKGHWQGALAWIAPSRHHPGTLIWWGRVATTAGVQGKKSGKWKFRQVRTIAGRKLRAKIDKDAGAVPLFVLVRAVKLKKILDDERTARRWADAIPDLIERALPGEI